MKYAVSLLKQGPSLQHLVAFSFFVAIVFPVLVQERTTHPSIWLHLRTGQHIVETQSLPRHDPFSSASPGRSWINTQWLGEILFYEANSQWGYQGLVLMAGLLATASCLTVFAIGYCLTRRVDIALGCAGWATWVLEPWAVPRTRLWTYLFMSVLLLLLVSSRSHGRKWILWLAPVVLGAWCSFDIWCGFGLVILTLYWLVQEICLRLGIFDLASAEIQPYRLACPVALLACLMNPYGYAALLVPIEQFVSPLRSAILEWHPPNLQSPSEALPLTIVMMVLIGVLGLSSARGHPGDVCVAVIMTWGAFHARQFLPMLAIAVTPLVATVSGFLLADAHSHLTKLSLLHNALARALLGAGETISRLSKERARVYWIPLIALFGSTIAYMKAVPVPDISTRYPVRAADFLSAQAVRGRLFSSDLWAGYLIYRLWPRHLSFMDDRLTLVYAEQTVRDYFTIVSATPGWQEMVDQYEIQIMVLSARERRLEMELRRLSSWRELYRDPTTTIFARSGQVRASPVSSHRRGDG
jgi:hypothetical protein